MPENEEQTIEEIVLESDDRMERSFDAFTKDLNNIRSTRATPSMLDHIHVEYYGAPVPLIQLATINVPESRMLVISPFDKGSIADIEKAIMKSDIGITPQNDGSVIRLILPELSMERRKELVKQVHHRLEEARVAIRNIRRDGNDAIKKLKGHSEDEIKDAQDEVQKITNSYIVKAEEAADKKEKSILQV